MSKLLAGRFRLCLVEVKIWRMKNGGEKIREVLNKKSIWLERFWRRENGGTYLFFLWPTIFQLPQIGEKMGRSDLIKILKMTFLLLFLS